MTDDSTFPPVNEKNDRRLTSTHVTNTEIRLILDNLHSNKATGPDEISGRILKECARELTPSITKICNLSLSQGKFPHSWKLANVVPVYKKGCRKSAENYRPVSLLSIVSKVLERAVIDNIYEVLLPQLNVLQHGFLRGKSTVTQLLSVFNEISSHLDESGQTDVIYSDFSKAFDSVPHHLLIHKLKSFGFNGPLLNWFASYLTDRSQRVVIDGEMSSCLPVLSGVPQGSILGPLLFLLYINDISNNLTPNSKIALFADDAKIFRRILSLADCISLQSDLSSLEYWSKTWLMNFNAKKCKVMTIARRVKHHFEYYLNNTKLDHVNEFNDLGVFLSSDMTWSAHIRPKVSKANQLLGMIKRSLGVQAPIQAKRLLFSSLIKPSLLYGSIIWSANKHDTNLIESVQRRATKYILNDYASDYKARLKRLNLLPISYCKEIADVCFLYKCINKFYQFDISEVVKFVNVSNATRSASFRKKLAHTIINTETFANFFSNRVVHIWNSLPDNIRCIVSKNKFIRPFKRVIRGYYASLTETRFNVDDACTWTTCCRCPRCRPA